MAKKKTEESPEAAPMTPAEKKPLVDFDVVLMVDTALGAGTRKRGSIVGRIKNHDPYVLPDMESVVWCTAASDGSRDVVLMDVERANLTRNLHLLSFCSNK